MRTFLGAGQDGFAHDWESRFFLSLSLVAKGGPSGRAIPSGEPSLLASGLYIFKRYLYVAELIWIIGLVGENQCAALDVILNRIDAV